MSSRQKHGSLHVQRGDGMQCYDDLVNLARICVRQAREVTNDSVRGELMRMAKLYQQRAAEIDEGKLPDIGEDHFSRASSQAMECV